MGTNSSITSAPSSPSHTTFEFFVEAFALTAILSLAVIGNFTTVITILRVPSLRRNLHNAFVVNLCLIDLVVCLFSMSFSITDLFNEGYLGLPENEPVCLFNCFMAIFALYGNFSGVTLIAVNRCLGIVYSHKIKVKRSHAIAMIMCSWCYSFIIALPTAIPDSPMVGTYNKGTHHCSPNWEGSDFFNILCIILLYGVTVPVMIVSYVLIIREIKKRRAAVKKYRQSPGPGPSSDNICNGNTVTVNRRINDDITFFRRLNAHNSDVRNAVVFEENGIIHLEAAGTRNETMDENEVRLSDTRDLGKNAEEITAIGVVRNEVRTTEYSVRVVRYNTEIGTHREWGGCREGGPDPTDGDIADCAVVPGSNQEVVTSECVIPNESGSTMRKIGTQSRVAMAGALLVLTTTLCWMPYYIVIAVHAIDEHHGLAVFAMWLGYTNSALDPVIYSILNQRIRNSIKEGFTDLLKKLRLGWNDVVGLCSPSEEI